MKKKLTVVDMVSEFQCPGCSIGTDAKSCERFKLNKDYGARCESHSAGTFLMGKGKLAIGLPRGFNRYGVNPNGDNNFMMIRLWDNDISTPLHDRFNIPVWKFEENGFIFIRTFSPRVNASYVDVIQLIDKKFKDIAPNAIDVTPFYEEMD